MVSFLRRYGWLIVLLALAGYYIGRYLYFQPKYTNGVGAPNFSATLPDGRNFALSDLQGSYVLLDFWGSWCGPCRVQSPALRALHQQYREAQFEDADGLKIVSVGIERDSTRWQAAIAADQLNWPHHIMETTPNLRFFDAPIANLYGIKEVPTTYLINPRGEIIGVNMALDQVDRLLQQSLE